MKRKKPKPTPEPKVRSGTRSGSLGRPSCRPVGSAGEAEVRGRDE